MIYLDHAATTPPDALAIQAIETCLRAVWQNPAAAYSASDAARRELRLARQAIADALSAEPQEIIFTSGGTEGNNHAMTLARTGHAVVGATEHDSVLRAARQLCQEVTLVAPDRSGRICPDAIERALRPETRLISVQFANNETGVLQPASEIGALARSRRIPFHCDAVQAFGHVPVDARRCEADLITLSAHKFYGPRGAGALYVRTGTRLTPLIDGGGQEFGLRSGTEDVAAIAGMRAAVSIAQADMIDRAARERTLMEWFIGKLRRLIPCCRVLGDGAPRLPGISAVLLPGLPSEQAVADLDLMEICVSGGSACAARSGETSRTYRAMGLSDTDARCVLRVSIGRNTTVSELEIAADAIAKVYRRRVG